MRTVLVGEHLCVLYLLCLVPAADSIDLEYSDWTIDQQQDLAALVSYDLAADAMPAEQAAAATVAAAAAPAVEGAVSCGATEGAVIAEELGAVTDPHEAPSMPEPAAGDVEEAVAAEEVEVEEAAEDTTFSYSMDFASMSLQQSLVSDLADATAAAAATAPDTQQEGLVPLAPPDQQDAELTSSGSSSAVSPQARPSAAVGKLDPLIEELKYRHSLKDEMAAAEAVEQQQQQQLDGSQLIDTICSAALDKMLTDVLAEAVRMWGQTGQQAVLAVQQQQEDEQQQQQRLLPSALQQQQQHLQQEQPDKQQVSAASASSAESAETVDTADSSADSKTLQPDWQSSPGSPPPHLSPLSMRAAATGAVLSSALANSSRPGALAAGSAAAAAAPATDTSSSSSQHWPMSHPPTDWTPLSDDSAMPWSAEATASSRLGAASSSLGAAPSTAATDEDGLGLASTVRQLDPLLSQAAIDGDGQLGTAAAAEEAVQQQLGGSSQGLVLPVSSSSSGMGAAEQEPAASSSGSSTTSGAAISTTSAAAGGGDELEGDAAGLALSSARGPTAADEDEFDWPDPEQVCVCWVLLLARHCYQCMLACIGLQVTSWAFLGTRGNSLKASRCS